MAIAFRYKDKEHQLPEKLINPVFLEEFEVGKHVEPVAVFNVKPYEYLTEMKLLFNYIKENRDIPTDLLYDIIEISHGIANNKINWDKLLDGIRTTLKEQVFDFAEEIIVDSVNEFSKKIEIPIKDEMIYRFNKNINKIKETIYSKINEINNLLSNGNIKKVREKASSYDVYALSVSEILQVYSDILKESNFDKIGNIFYNDIFKIYKIRNAILGESKNIIKYFIDKHPQHEELFVKFLEELTTNIEKEVFNSKRIEELKDFMIFKFFDKSFFQSFNIPRHKNYIKELFFQLLNPENLQFFDTDYINSFSDFNEFIEKSNILKNDKAFSLWFYYSNAYLYEFLANSEDFDKSVLNSSFDDIIPMKMDELLDIFPIRDEHIRNLGKEQTVYLYKLNPEKSKHEFHGNVYSSELMKMYFGIANSNSCVREEIMSDIKYNKIEKYNLPSDAEFMIIADKNGKTLGRFSIHDGGDIKKVPMNIFLQGKSHLLAFHFGGRAIMEKYLEEIGYKEKDNIDKSLMYGSLAEMINNDRVAFIENRISMSFMGEMFFYINQILVPFEKFYRSPKAKQKRKKAIS